MKNNHPTSKISIQEKWPELMLIALLLFMTFIHQAVSGGRFFSFDEFQVLYESASLTRGKTLYLDEIGSHFPFFNICIHFLIRLTGFQSTAILVCRYFVLFINIVSLYFLYNIGRTLWNKKIGLLSVVMTLLSIVFLNRSIEIRHDVFNMMFNIIGVYYLLRYLEGKKFSSIFFSGLSLGLALASTQKAVIWICGIIAGMTLFYLKERDFRGWMKINIIYSITIPLPLALCLSYLAIFNHESLYQFFNHAIVDPITTFAPFTKEVSPFPYNRWDIFGNIIFRNPLFYIIGTTGILLIIVSWSRASTTKIVVAVWALIGLLFYITAKRPFDQSLLPTIPALAVSASGVIEEISRKLRNRPISNKIAADAFLAIFLFIWPLHSIRAHLAKDAKLGPQIDNISFCLDYLKPDDKVLCFTQNQIFFDQVLKTTNDDCGRLFYEFEADCFERRMIAEQCKVIINDCRTRLLNHEIQERIRENYFTTRIGNILIPGFKVGPKMTLEKKIWIKGYYYSPTLSLEIDGENIKDNVLELRQKKCVFYNGANNPIFLIYIFDKEKFINDFSAMKVLKGTM